MKKTKGRAKLKTFFPFFVSMENALLIGSAFVLAYVLFRFLTRPDPAEEAVVRQFQHVLNDPQYRVKGKYE